MQKENYNERQLSSTGGEHVKSDNYPRLQLIPSLFTLLYITANDPLPYIIPRPQMILDRRWSPLSTAYDPPRKIRMPWTQVTGLSCHVYYRNKKY